MEKYKKLERKHDREVVSQIESMRFYEFNSPVGPLFNVCLLFGENGYLLARGVSVRSVLDGYNRKAGRNRALGRAIKALHNMASGLPIQLSNREDADDPTAMISMPIKVGKTRKHILVPKYLHLEEASKHFNYKSEFAPKPTEYEQQMFG